MAFQCLPQLPPEIFARLDCLYSLKNIQDQIDLFSELLPVSGKKALRWHKPLQCLPYHHRISSHSKSKLLTVDILFPGHDTVLTLRCKDSACSIVQTMTLKQLAKGQRTYYSDSSWVPMSATKGQKFHIAKLLSLPVGELPAISAYNAALVIDSGLMMKHWKRVNLICRIRHSGQHLQKTA